MSARAAPEQAKTEEQWSIWSFHHRLSHAAIRQAIQAQRGLILPDYQLDPVSANDLVGWLQRNAQTHSEMNSAVGTQSQDLLDVDFKQESQFQAWIFSHYQEHYDAENALRI